MAARQVQCKVRGKSPLLMHAFPMIPQEAAEKKTPAEQAEYAAYRDPNSRELYVPGVAIQRCLVNAASYSKGKGRASLQKPVAACVLINPERCGLGKQEFAVDSRPVVVPATKGRIVRHRPRLDEWAVQFEIEFDDTLMTEAELRRVVDDAGTRVGLLDFRPEKKGPFGRFMVVEWKLL